MEAKKILKANGITFSSCFPARLRVRTKDIQFCRGSDERYGCKEPASYCHQPARITDRASTVLELGDGKQKDGMWKTASGSSV